MTDLQSQMDRGARNLRRMIAESTAAADALCEAGDAQGSADAWKMVSLLAAAMAHGRRLNVGGIQPQFGSK